MSYCLEGFRYYSTFLAPERLLYKKLPYEKHPNVSRAIAISSATIAGIAKPFLFPFMSVSGVIGFPIAAVVKAARGNRGQGYGCLNAWVFSIIGLGLTVSFLTLSALYLSLIASVVIFMGATAISLAVHVYKAIEAPIDPNKGNLRLLPLP